MKNVITSPAGLFLGYTWFTRGGFWRGTAFLQNLTDSRAFATEADAEAFVRAAHR